MFFLVELFSCITCHAVSKMYCWQKGRNFGHGAWGPKFPSKHHIRVSTYTPWTEKHTPKCFLICSLQNLTDYDKIWYMLSWVNLSYRNVNVFLLTWIMSLPYLVKLGIAFCKWTAVKTVNRINMKMFLSYLLQNDADSHKVWHLFSWLNLPQRDVKVKKLQLIQ